VRKGGREGGREGKRESRMIVCVVNGLRAGILYIDEHGFHLKLNFLPFPPSLRRLSNNGAEPFPSDTRLVFAYGHLMEGPMEGVLVGRVEPGEEFRHEKEGGREGGREE